MRTPDEILTDFDAGCSGVADYDMREILHEVIADICSSYTLAINAKLIDLFGISGMYGNLAQKVAEEMTNDINTTVEGYIVNNYGDD